MTSTQSAKGSEILHKLYDSVLSLEDWLLSISKKNDLHFDVKLELKSASSNSFRKFLSETLVASLVSTPPLRQPVNVTQVSCQQDVIRRVQQSLVMNSKGHKNVISLGYYQNFDRPKRLISSDGVLVCKFINHASALVNYSNWQTLITIIGDIIMEYLLSKTGVFVPCGSTNYMQLAGPPVYDLKMKDTAVLPTYRLLRSLTSSQSSGITDSQNSTPFNQSPVENIIRHEGSHPVEDMCVDEDNMIGDRADRQSDMNDKQDIIDDKQKYITDKQYTCDQLHIDRLYDVRDTQDNISDTQHTVGNNIFKMTDKQREMSVKQYTNSYIDDNVTKRSSIQNLSYQSCHNQEYSAVSNINNIRKRKRRGGKKWRTKRPKRELVLSLDINPHQVIPTMRALYGVAFTENIPKNSVLSSLSIDNTSKFFDSIFLQNIMRVEDDYKQIQVAINSLSAKSCHVNPTLQGYISNVKHQVTPLLLKFIQQHRKCPYRALMNVYCGKQEQAIKHKSHLMSPPTEKTKATKNKTEKKQSMKIGKTSPKQPSNTLSVRQVFLFLRMVCHKVIPKGLLGARNNNSKFEKVLKMILQRRKYDKIRLVQIMTGMKVNECDWLKEVANDSVRQVLLGQVLHWLVTEYILVVIKSFFTVTDSCGQRNKLFYYRRSVWTKLQKQASEDFMKQGNLKPTSLSLVNTKIKQGQALGVSYLRFMPKNDKFRPIVNMHAKNKLFQNCQPINKQLDDLFKVLKYLTIESPHLLGSTVNNPDDIYSKIKQFKDKILHLHNPKLYFVKVDICGCFDHIIQTKLYDILRNIISKGAEQYYSHRYALLCLRNGKVQVEFCRKMMSGDCLSFRLTEFLGELNHQKKQHSSIIVDQVTEKIIHSKDLLKTLHAHILNNFLQVQSRFYHQTCGISQGSILSTLFCNIYFGHMENELQLCHPDDLVMRMTDDYIYVSTDVHRASRFFHHMFTGIPEYNCVVNKTKLLVNFPCVGEGGHFVKELQPHAMFPWCGLMFDPLTLSVSVDYSSYAQTSITETLTYDLGYKPGNAMKQKLISIMKPKFHPLFLYNEINTNECVIKNMHQLFLITAFRFHSYSLQLLPHHRPQYHATFFLGVIKCISSATPNYLNKKLTKMGYDVIAGFSCKIISWLCYRAFFIKLGYHRSQYTSLIKMLHQELRKVEDSLGKETSCKLNTMFANMPEEFLQMLE